MKAILLSVEKNDFNFNNQLQTWEKQGFNLLRALNMNEAIELSCKNNLTAVGINADNINYLPQLTILRDCINIPIYVMTSNFSYDECFKVVEAGADVYMQWNELGAISLQMFNLFKRVFKSKYKEKAPDIVGNADITIYPEYRRVFVNDTEINLRKKEFNILCYLTVNKDKVLTFEQIILNVWGEEYGTEEHRLLWNQMSNLKKKLSDVSDKYEYIESIKGVGYKFKSN